MNQEITIEKVFNAVTNYTKIDLKQKTRKSEVALARQLFFYICDLHNLSYTESAKYVGYNRTTAIHGIKAIDKFKDVDAIVARDIHAIESLLIDTPHANLQKQIVRLERENKALRDELNNKYTPLKHRVSSFERIITMINKRAKKKDEGILYVKISELISKLNVGINV